MTTPEATKKVVVTAVAEESNKPHAVVEPPAEHERMPPDGNELLPSLVLPLPTDTRATGLNPRTAKIEQLLPTEEERLASLRAFVEEKQFAPDYFGGHKGSAEGPPNDPFKVLKWAKRKIGGEKGHVWEKLTAEQRQEWEAEGGYVNEAQGEIAKGDLDSSKIL